MQKCLPFLVAGALLAAACGEDAETAVNLRFSGLVNGEAAACGSSYAGIGTTGSTMTINDYRMYIHDIRLLDADGEEVVVALDQNAFQLEDIALLDFEDGSASCELGTPETHTAVTGIVADGGPFTGIRFKVGVPFDRNHADVSSAPAPLNLSSMFWNWAGGYKFIRMDGPTDGQGGDMNFRIHLGSTGCDGDPLTGGTTTCANANRPEIELTGFDPTAASIDVDVANVVSDSDVDTNQGPQPGCMSNPMDMDCSPIFEALGLPFGGASAGNQQLFSVGN